MAGRNGLNGPRGLRARTRHIPNHDAAALLLYALQDSLRKNSTHGEAFYASENVANVRTVSQVCGRFQHNSQAPLIPYTRLRRLRQLDRTDAVYDPSGHAREHEQGWKTLAQDTAH